MLDAALIPFMRNGLHATSLSDLEIATGLSKGSLYKAYPSKREMFIAVLQRCLTDLQARLNDADLDEWFAMWCCDPEDMHPGIELAVRTAAMASYDDPEVGRELAAFFETCRQNLKPKLAQNRAMEVLGLAQGFAVEAIRQDRQVKPSIRDAALAKLLA
ncbi:MAG: TetR/AcrR family transcriptional regulator [Chthonomonas sp.]|nr:TetR/AcrR family transcriptional regulator [Chthonomonas sp.]